MHDALTEDEMDDAKTKLIDVLRSFDTLMVATRTPNGSIHARPMAVADVDDGGEVWFVTAKESEKVDETSADAAALVTGQDDHRYVSVSGQLDIINDRERIAALWKASWNVWFPEGKDDPSAVLMRLRPQIAEYWLQGGLKGVRYLFEATRALLDGTTPRDEALDHAKVSLQSR